MLNNALITPTSYSFTDNQDLIIDWELPRLEISVLIDGFNFYLYAKSPGNKIKFKTDSFLELMKQLDNLLN